MSRIAVGLILALVGCSADKPSENIAAEKYLDVCNAHAAGTGRAVDYQRTSMVALLGNPDQFEGKPVSVIGFYHGSFEHSAIYLNHNDFRHGITSNGLWVANTVPDTLNDRYVLLEGIFTTTGHGHLGQWSGELCGIGKAVPWGRDEP